MCFLNSFSKERIPKNNGTYRKNKMAYSLDWNPEHTLPAVVLFTMIIVFNIFWFTSTSENLNNKALKKYGQEKGSIYWGLFGKYFGVLLLGIIPAVVVLQISDFSLSDLGLNSKNLSTSLVWIAGLSLVALLVNLKSARQPESIAYYPQIRATNWSYSLLIHNTLGWMAYLIAYEFLFRGLMIFALIPVLGVWPTIAINTALYSATHIPKSMKEAIGAMPFGVGLSALTIYTENIWIAVFVHIALALSNDYVALYHNPQTKLVKSFRLFSKEK